VGDTRACCSFGGVTRRYTCGGEERPHLEQRASQMQLAESGDVHEQQVYRTPIRARTGMWTVDGGWLSSVARKVSCSVECLHDDTQQQNDGECRAGHTENIM
jgi:hypothetical protein